MPKPINSDALGVVNRVLGITGPGAPETDLFDAELFQTLDVNDAVRRGRTQGATQGMYHAVMRNIHGAGSTIVNTVTPYDLAVGAIAPFPSPIPNLFDLWLLAASVRRVSGTGTIGAALFMSYADRAQGFGIDDSGVAVVESQNHPIAFWDAVAAVSTAFLLQNGDRGPWARIGLRLPRDLAGTEIIFQTVTSALATYDLQLALGLFPTALGQDGLV